MHARLQAVLAKLNISKNLTERDMQALGLNAAHMQLSLACISCLHPVFLVPLLASCLSYADRHTYR